MPATEGHAPSAPAADVTAQAGSDASAPAGPGATPTRAARGKGGLPRWAPWLAGALVLVAFTPTLEWLVRYWWDHSEYSHGFLMPLIAAWMLREKKDELRALEPRPSWIGLLLLVPAVLLLLLRELKLSLFLGPYAFVGVLGALTLAFWGWRAVRLALPSLVALFLMCPLPERIQLALTVPLMNFAARLATGLLLVSGVPTSLEGNVIYVPNTDGLNVAEACSGITSLISLGSLAILAGFFWKVPLWLRAVVVVSAVPIAILVNSFRIYVMGMLSAAGHTDLAEGFMHYFQGFVLFLVAGLFLLGWALLLDWLRRPAPAAPEAA